MYICGGVKILMLSKIRLTSVTFLNVCDYSYLFFMDFINTDNYTHHTTKGHDYSPNSFPVEQQYFVELHTHCAQVVYGAVDAITP